MPLPAGTTLGFYEILAPIGAGGMGEVYRAKDTKLDRQVAIKVLPDTLAEDPDRLARFEREAKVRASLNHPNIAQIYGIEANALVMELVEGDTLKCPAPLEYAKQIAEALEAAHEKGITHRDLKPGNIMVTPDGDGRQLLFLTQVRVMTVTYTAKGESFAAEKPQLWTEARVFAPAGSSYYDLAPDGKRLATMVADADAGKLPTHLTFLLNFFDELAAEGAGEVTKVAETVTNTAPCGRGSVSRLGDSSR